MEKEGLGLEITELRLGLPGTDKKRKHESSDDSAGPRKAPPVVGWPPVCTYRRKNSLGEKDVIELENSKMYVKVSMDGAPFLRKIDLGTCKGYSHLALALEKLFDCFGLDKDGDNCEYVPIYEDKDGDWMLAGDVPWEMFIESCKRLRIMKKCDAKGYKIQPRDLLKNISKDISDRRAKNFNKIM